MTDPATTAAIAAGIKRIGKAATDWWKGPPSDRLAAALAGRVTANDFQLIGFESLARDGEYEQLINSARRGLRFDVDWAREVVRRHVGDIRGEAEEQALVERVVHLLRSLLPAVVGDADRIGLQTGLQHQDAERIYGSVEETRLAVEEMRATLATFTMGEGQRLETVLFIDRQWLSGRASEAWERLVALNELEAATLRRQLGDTPTVADVRQYLEATDRASPEVWETLVSIADELGDWQLLEDVALRYATSEGADEARGLAWAAGAADIRGDATRRDELLSQASEVESDHPSVLLISARIASSPRERLEILADIEPRDDRQRGALETARAHAHLEAGEPDAAFVSAKRAKAADPGDLLAAEVEAALIVADAREGRNLTWDRAEEAVEALRRVRDRLRNARRFDLSASVAGKIAQVYLLFGASVREIRTVVDSLLAEERQRDELALVAAGLLTYGDARGALELLPAAPQDEYAQFIFASALMTAEPERFRSEGVATLDQLLTATDESVRSEAAWIRVGAPSLNPAIPASDEAMRCLEEHDPVRARLARAAASVDPQEAEAILAAGGERAELLLERGRLAARREDWDTALLLFRRVVQLDPTPVNELAFASSLDEAGETAAAAEAALTVARRGDYPPNLRSQGYRLAMRLLQRAGDIEKQAAVGNEWLALAPEDEEVAWAVVWTLARLTRYREARSLIERRGMWPTEGQDAELYADVIVHTSSVEDALQILLRLSDDLSEQIQSVEARLAMLAVSVDADAVPSDVLDRARERLNTYPDRFPEGGIQRVTFDPADPLREIRQQLEEHARAVAEVWDALAEGTTLIAALAATTGRTIGGLLIEMDVLPLGLGGTELDDLEVEDAMATVGSPAVFDSTAITIAGGLGSHIYDAVVGAFQSPTISQAVVDEARAGARDALSARPSSSLGIDPRTGDAFIRDYTEEDLDRAQHRAESALALLRGLSVVPNVDDEKDGEIGRWLREEGHFDNLQLAAAETTLAVVERTGWALYSDDPVLRIFVRRAGKRAFGTPALLAALAAKGTLAQEDVDAAVEMLLRSGIQGLPVPMFDPIGSARTSNWGLTSELRAFVADRRRWNYDLDKNIGRWHDFLRAASREASHAQFQRWVFRIVDAMMLALPNNEPYKIVAGFGIGMFSTPALDQDETVYRRRLVAALDFVREFYGVREKTTTLITRAQVEMSVTPVPTSQAEASSDAPASATDVQGEGGSIA